MRKLAWLLVGLALVGCNNTEELEKKVGELEKSLEAEKDERTDLAKKVETLTTELATVRDTANKVDEIVKSQKRTMDVIVSRSTLANTPTKREPDKAKTYSVPIDGAPIDGPLDAKVTLVWAYEYQCPYCERSRTAIADVRKKYGNDLRVVYKQFVVHSTTAMASALAACAAGKQRKFPKLDKLLWDEGYLGYKVDRQYGMSKCWETTDGCPVVLGFARTAGLEPTRFKADMKACETVVNDGMRELTALGVTGTPSFFINGRFMTGAQTSYALSTLIDEELKKANDRIQLGSSKANYYKEWVIDRGQKTLDP